MTAHKINWTETDEAPYLATYSLLPIIQGFTKGTGVDVETERHLARRPHHRQLPRLSDRGPAHPRRPGPAGRAGPDARSQHHQAAEHQRLDPAAPGSHPGAPVPGLQAPRLSRGSQDRRREGDPGPLRQGPRQRRQPGPARRQLRPAGAPLGQELLQEAPPQAGRLEAGQQGPRRPHVGRRLLRQREVRDRGQGLRLPDRAPRRGRHGQGPQGQADRSRRRDPRAGRS